YLIFLLLIFPIGPAEETYWRGLIQRELQRKMSGRAAIIVTSSLYSLIHLPTLNPSLIFVALVGGLVWGYLFIRYKNDLLPCLVSHILFDELVFVALPIGERRSPSERRRVNVTDWMNALIVRRACSGGDASLPDKSTAPTKRGIVRKTAAA